jgi:hypothetical protein
MMQVLTLKTPAYGAGAAGALDRGDLVVGALDHGDLDSRHLDLVSVLECRSSDSRFFSKFKIDKERENEYRNDSIGAG